MVKQSQRSSDKQNIALALKPKSVSIQKPATYRSAKKAPESPSMKCLTTSASTASLGQCEGDRQQQEQLFCNYEEEQPRFVMTQTMMGQTAYQAGNFIQIVPQFVYQLQPMQYQVIFPMEDQRSVDSFNQESECNHDHHEELNQFESGSCCEQKKPAAGCMLSSRNVSAANTAASHGSDSELDEVEIEIPGGFENILEIEMSNSSFDESSEYVTLPKIPNWIGQDWDEVSITSDVSQNREDWLNGVTGSHLQCSHCSKKFRTQVELVACELSHATENVFKCPHVFCNSKYHKAAHLESHIRKRHTKHWPQFEKALKNATKVEEKSKIALLMQPTESMI